MHPGGRKFYFILYYSILVYIYSYDTITLAIVSPSLLLRIFTTSLTTTWFMYMVLSLYLVLYTSTLVPTFGSLVLFVVVSAPVFYIGFCSCSYYILVQLPQPCLVHWSLLCPDLFQCVFVCHLSLCCLPLECPVTYSFWHPFDVLVELVECHHVVYSFSRFGGSLSLCSIGCLRCEWVGTQRGRS